MFSSNHISLNPLYMKQLKHFVWLAALAVVASSCVPGRQFNELESRFDETREENRVLSERLDEVESDNARMSEDLADFHRRVSRLREDTTALGIQLRRLQSAHDQFVRQSEQLMQGQTEETRQVLARLQETQADLQRREDELMRATRQMEDKEASLNLLMAEVEEKERRVVELEDILQRQDSLVRSLRTAVSNALLGFRDEGLSVEIRNGKVYVSMEERLLFATGSTRVDSQGERALSELSAVLAQHPDVNIMVEGHTDDVPFRPGGPIQDNWELSVLRATSILRILLASGDIDPQRVIAAGRGEFQPIDPADSPEARRRNRRTEIILTPQLDELFQIIEQH